MINYRVLVQEKKTGRRVVLAGVADSVADMKRQIRAYGRLSAIKVIRYQFKPAIENDR